jgi:eukaryotic-like serine/threonine-protein kinase
MSGFPAEPPDDESPGEPAVDRAAALDDYLGGLTAESQPGAPPDGVSAHGIMPELLDTMLLLRQAAAAGGVVPPPAPAAVPRSIGRHAILRLAGEGGFATVWEGFDTVLRRPVAVKVRRAELLLSEVARRRFVREAEIAARLVHPHIVTIFEVGSDGGREFIAAEYCSGGSLAAWLERQPGPLPPRVAAGLVRALATAAAHAHAAGVVHRDIKPANVLLVPVTAGSEPDLPAAESTGGGFTVKLGDFGLGKLVAEEEQLDPLTQLTRSGTSIGTPAWMAPEQVDRSFGPVGPATDVHALGLLLHRLLAGRALRDGGTDAETYRQVLLEEPETTRRFIAGVPRDLAAVASRCLAKRPRDRYGSAAELAADLDRWLAGLPTVARPLSPAGRAARWVRRRPVVSGLAAAAVIASLAAGWAGLERARDARRAAAQDGEISRQRAGAELRRAFEALRAGNVAGALGLVEATRGLDSTLADSLAGRWLVRRTHGEREILLAAPPASGGSSDRPRDLYSIAVTADGHSAAVAGADGTVHLFRGLSGQPVITAALAHDEVNDAEFSPDGRRLATAGQDGRLRWWRLADAGLVAEGEAGPGTGPLYAAVFTPDGRAIVTGGEDRVVRLVPLDSPDRPVELFRFEPPPGKSPEIESLLFVGEGLLAVACGDLVVLLDPATGRLVRELERVYEQNRNAVLGSLTVSPDGRQVMACGTDTTAHVWDVATGRIASSLPTHPAWVQGCAFSPDGSRIATACRDGGLRIFDAASKRLLNRMVGHEGRVWSVAWEPAGTLLSAGADGTVRRWDPETTFDAAVLRPVPVAEGEWVEVVAGPVVAQDPAGGARVLALSRGGRLWEIDPLGLAACELPLATAGHPAHIAVDPARRRVAVCHANGAPPQVLSLDRAPGEAGAARPAAVDLPAEADPAWAVCAWTPAGDLVVRTQSGGVFWRPGGLGPAQPIGSLEGVVHRLAAAPAGAPRVAAIGDRAMIVPLPLPRSPADRSGGGSALELPVTIETTAVAWSPDAATIACGTRTGAVLLFDAKTGVPRGALAPHERMVEALAFAPDGRTLLSADRDALRLSDSATLTTFDELRPGFELRDICLTGDGMRLVLAGAAAEGAPAAATRLVVMEPAPP